MLRIILLRNMREPYQKQTFHFKQDSKKLGQASTKPQPIQYQIQSMSCFKPAIQKTPKYFKSYSFTTSPLSQQTSQQQRQQFTTLCFWPDLFWSPCSTRSAGLRCSSTLPAAETPDSTSRASRRLSSRTQKPRRFRRERVCFWRRISRKARTSWNRD
ncbi:Hypothetical_protein [Hexamita inflata]|uniref:Hypothetical_protein n=1 Tax=Hexamita inflata TaxID=28002 RepID=A0AA86RHB3_9EUKA|nr:Hypothetical protein HINF_LOCUS60277 [Hexamita inflata]CAI9972637.1 Hypothetical protein HINF_LOCUS60282 [Hexamita inflata]